MILQDILSLITGFKRFHQKGFQGIKHILSHIVRFLLSIL